MPACKVINGLRVISPYYQTRTSHVKGRWLGRTLLDVLSSEFRSYSNAQLEIAIREGKQYTVERDGRQISGTELLNTLIEPQDVLKVVSHNHEPPVLNWTSFESGLQDIEIVHEDSETLVINKPSGIPVHPTGHYYFNTVTELLHERIHIKDLRPCHRLDRPTSGILVLAKTSQRAQILQEQIRSRNLSKYYLARVKGKFPGAIEQSSVRFDIDELTKESNRIIADSHIYTIDPKRQYPAGIGPPREAITHFFAIDYSSKINESIVLCKPLTGRTHQIRIHLARLGHPITNDNLYNSEDPFHKYPKRLEFVLKNHDWRQLDDQNLASSFAAILDEYLHFIKPGTTQDRCLECGSLLLPNPHPDSLKLNLHAWQYFDSNNQFHYQTSLPSWTNVRQVYTTN